MSHEQRTMIAKTVFDLANLVSIALVFGQFVSSQAFSIKVFLLGIMVASAQVVSIGLLLLGILTTLALYGVAHLFYVAARWREQNIP